ncbi:hypothetical protein PI124_g7492 [Phytophthora idaei]|nr:hypothetical protein PI124_g7492 [Phytophthora idaei]
MLQMAHASSWKVGTLSSSVWTASVSPSRRVSSESTSGLDCQPTVSSSSELRSICSARFDGDVSCDSLCASSGAPGAVDEVMLVSFEIHPSWYPDR